MEVIEIGRQYWGTHSECRLDTLKDEKFFRDIENRLVDLNIYSVGIQEEENKENGKEAILEKIMAENSPDCKI